MTLAAALALALPLAATPAPAAKPKLPPTPPQAGLRMGAIFAKASPAVRAWVDAEARRFRPLPPPDATALETDARQAFPAARPPLTNAQADVLAAMAAYQLLSDLDSEARLGEETALRFQALSDRKTKLLQTLDGLLRRFSDADAAVVAALK